MAIMQLNGAPLSIEQIVELIAAGSTTTALLQLNGRPLSLQEVADGGDGALLQDSGGSLSHQDVADQIAALSEPQPVALIDFKNSAYEVDGVATTLGALVGPTAASSYLFDSETVVEGVGLTSPSGGLLGAALAAVMSEAGAVVVFRGVAGATENLFAEAFDDDAYTTDLQLNWSYSPGSTVGGNALSPDPSAGAFALAFLVSPELIAASANGAAAASDDNVTISAPINAFGFFAAADWIIEQIEVWSAEDKGLADLPALSALPEEEGGAPEWVPEGAVYAADFLNDPARYYADGELVALEDFAEEDLANNSFDPSDIVAGVGFVGGSLTFKGAALAYALGGARITVYFTSSDGSGFARVDAYEANFDTDYYVKVREGTDTTQLVDVSTSAATIADLQGDHVMIWSLTPTAHSLTLDGVLLLSRTPSAPTPAYDKVGFTANGANMAITKVALSALS